MSKYAALAEHLRDVGHDELELSFEEIAHIITGYLPKAAEKDRYWSCLPTYANIQAAPQAAMSAGYMTTLMVGQDRVLFVKRK